MSQSMRKFLFAILIPAAIVLSPQRQATGQEVFSPVPEAMRSRLNERLKLLVEYERKKQWGKEYDLLSQQVTQGETKEDFVARLRTSDAEGEGYKVQSFTPKYTTLIYKHRWQVFGCVRVLHRGRTLTLNGEVAAILENGEWFFSQVSFDQEPCSR